MVKTITDEMREAHERMRGLITAAETADRDLTPDEDKELKDLEGKLQALDGKRKRSEALAGRLRSVEGLMPVRANGNGAPPLTSMPLARPAAGGVLPLLLGDRMALGSAFTENEMIKSLLGGGNRPGGQWSSPPIEIEAVVTINTPPIPSGTFVQAPPPVWPFDLTSSRFGQGTADAGSIPYLVETSFTNAADYVAVSGAKPESTKVFTLSSATLLKIAHMITVPDEFLDDVAALRSYIDANMAGGLIAKLEKEVIDGDGLAGHIMGLMALPGKSTTVAHTGTTPLIAAIATAASRVWTTSKRRPDTVVLSPQTYQNIVMQVNPSGGFLLPAQATSPSVLPLYGLTPVQNPEMTDGEAIVGAFQEGSMLFRKGGIVVQATNSHSDYFQKNQTAIRAEMRVALAHFVPSAYCLVTGLV
jgi:Phage capsid family